MHNNWIKKERCEILNGFSECGSIGANQIKNCFEGAKLINVFSRNKSEWKKGKISNQNELIFEFDNGKMLGIANPDMSKPVYDLFYSPNDKDQPTI